MVVDQFHFSALRWYFTQYESEIGIKSINMQGIGGGTVDPDRVAFAVRRGRRVDKVLSALPAKHRRVLVLVHTPHQYPNDKVGGLSEDLKGIAFRLRKPEGVPVKAWAEGRFLAAHAAFSEKAAELRVKVE